MRSFKSFLIFCFLLFSSFAKGQNTNDILSQIKHIEIVSEIQDTMALINKDDINKINKVFYERNYLDSLRIVDSTLIQRNEEIQQRMDSIVKTQLNTIANQGMVIKKYKTIVEENSSEIADLEKQQKRDKNSKIVWQSTTGTLAAVVILLLLI